MAFKVTTQKLNTILSKLPGRNAIIPKSINHNFSTLYTRVNNMQWNPTRKIFGFQKGFGWAKWAIPLGGVALLAKNVKLPENRMELLQKYKLHLALTAGFAGLLASRRIPRNLMAKAVQYAAPPSIFVNWGYLPDDKPVQPSPDVEEVHLDDLHFYVFWKWNAEKDLLIMIRNKEAFDENWYLQEFALKIIQKFLSNHPNTKHMVEQTKDKVAEHEAQVAEGVVEEFPLFKAKKPLETSENQVVPPAKEVEKITTVSEATQTTATADQTSIQPTQPTVTLIPEPSAPPLETTHMREISHFARPLLVDCPPSTSTFANFKQLNYL